MNKDLVTTEIHSNSIKLNDSAITLGKNLSAALYGKTDNIGEVIEEALHFYSSHKESQSTADIILRNINDKFESMFNAFAKNNSELANRLTELILIPSFETTLAELMLKDLYCRDQNAKNKYEQLRLSVAKTLTDHFQNSNSEMIVRLRDEIDALKNQLEILESELNSAKQREALVQEKYNTLHQQTLKIKTDYTATVNALKAYLQLAEWQEKRIHETPDIKEKNSSLLKKQTWQDALKEFDSNNPRPKVPTIKVS